MKKTLLIVLVSVLLVSAVFASDDQLTVRLQEQIGYAYHNRDERPAGLTGDPTYTFNTMGPVADVTVALDFTDQFSTELGFAYQLSLQKQEFGLGETQRWEKIIRKNGTADSFALKGGAAYSFNLGEGNSLKLRAGAQIDIETATTKSGKMKTITYGGYLGVTDEISISQNIAFVGGVEAFYGVSRANPDLPGSGIPSVLSFNGKAGISYQF